jgi:hypothetical protein
MSQSDLRDQKVNGPQYIAGENIYFHAPSPLEKKQQNYRAYIINQVRFSWIKGVLEPSVVDFAPITPGLQMQPDMVVNPLDTSVQEQMRLIHFLLSSISHPGHRNANPWLIGWLKN